MKTIDQPKELETSAPVEISDPSIDSLSTVFKQVREDAVLDAEAYLKETIVSEGGE